MHEVGSSPVAVSMAGGSLATAQDPSRDRRDATRHLPLRAPLALASLCLLGLLALIAAGPARAQEPVAEVLVFHDGSDAVTDAGIAAIEDLGAENDFAVTSSQDPSEFTAANLEQYRSVIFLGVESSPLGAGQLQALQGYVQDGGGFLGIGTSAEAQEGSSFFDGLIGARPDPASPGGTSEQVVAVGDRVHPASEGLPLEWERTDVWYQWETRPTGQVHTLARYHAPDAPAGDGTDVGGTDWPISWCRDFQGGRSFYTGMGRTAASYSEENFQAHLLGAIQWTAGLLRANCKATISSNYEAERVVDGTSGDLANTGESHGLSIAPNGWVIYIGRADCRTDEQRAEVAGLPVPTGRILDFTNPNVGVGCGPVHIFDPAEHEEGVVNSGTTLAGIIPVYGDRGGGNEINGKIEAGLLGVTVAPDFMQTGHIYVQYFPTFNPDNPVHPGLADGADRRRTKMQKARVSRFTIDLATKELDLDSEVVIFEYESQVYSCCHRGGGMGWDSEGNLYVTTGDSNSSQGSNGYSGNNPVAKCPQRNPIPGPGDPASNADCGELNFSYQDARRTAGSTNDYNGKMLRFNPIDSIADGAQPEVGVGTTYELPTADSPNGPNLFNGTEGAGGLTKPEIYAMGLRNPSRLAIDPETDIPYAAWVGPDAGAPNAQQGPSTYESATQLASAGNYGWPYCMGNGQGYRDRLADGSLRTSNAPGYVSGGPAGAPIPGFYDCENLHNDSPNNTGLTGALPHETGTGMDAGAMHPVNIWYSRGNPGGANGCPDFPRPNGAPDYGASPTQLCPYIVASGATVFTGPVYRHPDSADPAVAWPEYWDGRWFLFDFGNNSAEHGLLLDPETAAEGAQPVYADSLRSIASWSGNYMDSKFAPDGSLYVQTYDGFFTTGNNAGLVRITYTGGPDTPGADPQWEATGTPLEVQFDIGASGGVSYEWDFDDDGSPDSTEASPVHTFAESGPQDVTLTVTYADGGTDSKTITVNPSGEDTTPPVTTIQLDGADPVPTYDGPVEVTLDATDEGGVGVESTEYAIDDGAFQTYEDPFTVSGDGEHTVEYRSRDAAGNVEETKSVTFTIDSDGGGGNCLPQSDEFDGTELDAKWDVLREAAGGPQVADGSVTLPLLQGDFIANDPLAQNVLLQDAPGGEWTATTALDLSGIDENGEQAGLVIWKSENPNTFSKIVFIQSGAGNRQFEHIVTQNGNVDPPIPQSITPAPADLPANGTVLLRGRYDGDSVTAEFSDDNGATWTLIGQEGHEAPLAAPLRVGLTAFRGGSGGGEASFEWFRAHEGSEAGGPIDCDGGGACVVRSDEFDAAQLNTDRWTLVRNEPGRAPSVSDGSLVLPVAHGDIDGGNTGPITYVAQDAPDGAFEVTTRVAIEHTNEWQHGGLMMWVDDDNYTKFAFTMNPEGNRFIEYWTETGGARETHVDNINDPGTWPNHMFMRLASDGESELTASYSTDGESWTELEGTAPLWTDEGTQIGVNAMADEGEGNIDASFDFVRFTPDENCPGGDSCDEFEGTELDSKWEIVNPSATNPPTVSDDHLNMPVIQGDLFGGNGTAQMLLQGVPTDQSWVLTAKIEHEAIDTNGEAAGLALVNRFDPNHFAKTALQYKNDTGGGVPGVWAERVLTADSSAVTLPGETVPFPNSGLLEFEGDYGWVRFVHDVEAQEIGTWTSTDGEEFVNFGADMPVDEYLSEPGGLRAGVFAKHDGSGDDVVRLDAFNVVIGSADPQTPPDECDSGGGGDVTPPTTTATTDPADPNGENGWFTSPVEVTLEASDNEGGSGVESTEYAIDGGAFQAYTEPFTVEGDGQHEVEYRSTDAEGNVEATKSLDLKIDSTPPETEATVDGNEVTLDADDGPDGSGVALTEFRIDDGEFQPYVEEETILNSAADLARWAQAGPGGLNWVDEEGGFARTQGGLGMPWYPVKEYGDFSLKLQWRDSSEGTNGNSGVFVRFPDPRIPLAERPMSGPGDWDGQYCGRTGAAATQPAWVAIFCGQEIQINDHQGDTQKTGSIYNFAPVVDPDHMPQPKGTWVDYEVRVEGQQYTILRNGVVLNEFDNSIPLESSRAGDPPTDARQFDSGYIGLQNHGNPDVIDFRNVRVLPLDSGSVQGPIVVEPGEHTVEFRSTDAAGNVEEIKSVSVGGGGETELDLTTEPKRQTVKPGKDASFRAVVENVGEAEASEVEVCAKAPKRLVRIEGNDCRQLGSLAPEASEKEKFTLKPTRKARGEKIDIKFTASAENAPKATATATLKVKNKK
jgi:PKD repeat protein/glucose/arabinose dehydrogenase/type 1 glutamine amidotransferase